MAQWVENHHTCPECHPKLETNDRQVDNAAEQVATAFTEDDNEITVSDLMASGIARFDRGDIEVQEALESLSREFASLQTIQQLEENETKQNQ